MKPLAIANENENRHESNAGRGNGWSRPPIALAAGFFLGVFGSAIAQADDGAYGGTSASGNPSGTPKEKMSASPHLGLLGGVSDVPGDHTAGLVGLDLGFRVVGTPALFGLNLSIAGPGEDERRSSLLLKAAYLFGGSTPLIRSSYIGLNLGGVQDMIDIGPFVDEHNTYFAIGPILGFDVPFAQHWTVGAEAKYLANFTDAADDTFSVAGSIKYWY